MTTIFLLTLLSGPTFHDVGTYATLDACQAAAASTHEPASSNVRSVERPLVAFCTPIEMMGME